MQKANQVKAVLFRHNTRYWTRTVAQDASEFVLFAKHGKRSLGSSGINMSASKLYYIYVRKSDYDMAKHFIGTV